MGTYLPGTVLQGCRLFKRCLNLPAGHCVAIVQAFKVVSEHSSQALWAGVQAVYGVSEPTSHALCCRCAGCLSSVGTFLPGTVLQVAGCLNGYRTYLSGTVLQGCRLLKWYRNLPPRHCGAGVQAVLWG